MASQASTRHLTSGRLLARSTIWNLINGLFPMAIAVAAVPLLIRGIGTARFGILSLAYIVIGYFSLFDLGIGRALTKLVADRLGAGEEHTISPLAWTSLLLLLALGVLGGLATAGLSPWLIERELKIPAELHRETLQSFYLLALSIPVTTFTSGLRGILEAQQRFRAITLIRMPLSVFSYVGPLMVMPFSHSLVPVVIVLVVVRVLAGIAHLWMCFRSMPVLWNFSFSRSLIKPLVQFGGWMTVANLIGSISLYMDRFLIGTLVSVSAVAYYTAPFDLIIRLTIIPGAVVGVLFPAFAMSMVQDTNRAGLLLERSLKYVFLTVFPMVLVVVAFAPEGLRLWLGPVFSQNATPVLRWLGAGVFVISLATVPFALIQSAGRPDITGKLQIAEMPIYFVMLWLVTRRWGIEGTAATWTIRVIVDAILLFICSRRVLPQRSKLLTKLALATAVGLATLFLACLPSAVTVKAAFLVVGLFIFGWLGWRRGLGPEERAFLGATRTEVPIKT